MTNIDIYKKRITALTVMSTSPILGVSPFLVGLVGSWLTPGCTNEADCGWAALPWFMFFTIPASLVFFIIGLILFLVAFRHRLTKTTEPTMPERKLKNYYFAWISTAAGPLVFAVLLIVLAGFSGSSAVCDANDVCSQTTPALVNALVIIGAAFFAASWLYLIAVVIRNRFLKD